jgi:predicted nucleic acid-binding protein
MADALLDTDIVIDLLSGYPAALGWASANATLKMGISSIVWLEVMQGTDNKRNQQLALKTLNRFEIVPVQEPDNSWTMDNFLKFHLSHGVGVHDVLIAAVAVRMKLPLYRNVSRVCNNSNEKIKEDLAQRVG